MWLHLHSIPLSTTLLAAVSSFRLRLTTCPSRRFKSRVAGPVWTRRHKLAVLTTCLKQWKIRFVLSRLILVWPKILGISKWIAQHLVRMSWPFNKLPWSRICCSVNLTTTHMYLFQAWSPTSFLRLGRGNLLPGNSTVAWTERKLWATMPNSLATRQLHIR